MASFSEESPEVRSAASKPFSISVGFYFPKGEQGYTIAAHGNTKERSRGWVIDIGAARPGRGSSATTEEASKSAPLTSSSSPLDRGTTLSVSYDGSRQQQGLSFYLNGERCQRRAAAMR